MKLAVIALLPFLAATSGAKAQSVPDGLYGPSNEASSPSILSQDGKTLALGAALSVVEKKGRIYSLDNTNSRFWVVVEMPTEACADALSYILVVSNHAYASSGTGNAPDYCETDFTVVGADSALQVANYLTVPIEYRRHPGHELLVSFVPTRASFRAKDEVTATFRVENVGADTIAFMKGGHYRGSSRDNQYTFSARFQDKQVPDIGTSSHFGGIAQILTLKPGDVFTDTVELSRWFAFDNGGRYEVLGSYSMEFIDPADGSRTWSDFVSADFVVAIDE